MKIAIVLMAMTVLVLGAENAAADDISKGTRAATVRNSPSSAAGSRNIRTESWGVELAERYSVYPNVVYLRAGNVDLKLDIYQPRGSTTKRPPTLMYIHGGGWLDIYSKESAALELIPFLERGWAVLNVDYRPSSVALAPAAVEDCLCALRWIGRNGDKYGLDTGRLVVMGHSAGGHLALTTGMIPLARSGLGAPCAVEDMYGSTTDARYPPNPVKVAAIINWYGITDLAGILEGPEQQGYAVKWLGNQAGRTDIVRAVSPIAYVRAGLPPIVTVHGTSDHVVPYSQATQLHRALTGANIPNKLITVPNGGHGEFGPDVTHHAYAQVFDFLSANGVVTQGQ